MDADYVIVGGGSAGSTLAGRLTEDPRNSVILLEAGGNGRGWKVDMPAGSMFLVGHEGSDWGYRAEPDPTLNGRSIPWAAGRMLGGGSAINGQVYIRGTRADYDGWAAQGCTGWGFDDVLPYFRKAEGYEGGPPPPSHGVGGPLSVSRPRNTHPLLKTFIEGFHQLGLPKLDDYCGGDQIGVYPGLATHRHGQRCSAARAYLEPAMRRPNLRVVTHAFARRLLGGDGRITGVETCRDGEVANVTARRGVIVCAGALASPALLLRSGIGAGADLAALGIPVRKDLPGVGGNLQEHPAVVMNRFVNMPTYNSQMSNWHKLKFGLQYLLAKRGPLSSLGGQGLAFARTHGDGDQPDIQYHFSGASYNFTPDGQVILDSRPGILLSVNVCRPYSRGRIGIRDGSPEAPPMIAHRTYQDPRDMETMIAGCKFGERLFETPAFRPFDAGRYTPPTAIRTDTEWEAYIRDKTIYAYHPVGTCRMGTGPDAVVDPQLKVHGVDGLRIADASIMPNLISANTNAACIMIGEKTADIIKQESRN